MRFIEGVKRAGRAIARYGTAAVITTGAGLGTYGLYMLYHSLIYSEPRRAMVSNPMERQTPYRDLLHRIWNSDRKRFLTAREGYSTVEAFVFDPSRSPRNEQVIYSEGMDFGMRRALQMDDQQTVMKLRNGIKLLSKDGLPAWRSYLIDGKLVIKNDRDAASALDADMGIAFSFLEAAGRLKAGVFKPEGDFTYERVLAEAQQMMGIIYEKGIKPLGPYLLFGPSEDWGYEQGAVVYNVSYPAFYMLEAFASTDPVAGHNWRQVIADNQAMRKAIVGLTHIKDGQGNLVELRGLPDWVSVTWSPDKGFEYYTPGDRSFLPGYDSYRTLLNIALDAVLARDKNLRDLNTALAMELMQKVAGADAAQTLSNVSGKGVYTAVPGETEPRAIVCREFVLGAYTALAFAAGHEHKTILAEHLKNSYRDGFNKDNDPQVGGFCPADTPYSRDFEFTGIRIEDRYYDQFILSLAMQTFGSAYRRFDPALFSAEGKEKQEFCEKHHCDYGAHLEYIPYLGGHGWYVDPEERAELDLAKLVALLDHQGSDNLEVQLQAAGSWKKLQKLDQAILEYLKILKRNISPSVNREALGGLTGALKDRFTPADFRARIFEALDHENNPYARLGLAQARLDSGRPEYLDEENPGGVIKLAGALTDESFSFDQKLRAESFMLLAEAYYRSAKKEIDEYKRLASTKDPKGLPLLTIPMRKEINNRLTDLFTKALNNTLEVLYLPEGFDPGVSALAYLEMGRIYHLRAQALPLAENDGLSGRPIARIEDLDRAERDYLQALATNSLPGTSAADSILGIAKIRKEKALVKLWWENELEGYYSDYLEYIPKRTVSKEGQAEIEINRENLRQDRRFKSAEAIYDHVLNVLSGRGTPPNPNLEADLSRNIDLNLSRITQATGNEDDRNIAKERNKALEMLFINLRLSLINLSTLRDEKLMLIESYMEQIASLTPAGSAAGHLGRILFYVKNHEIRKALADCESILRLAEELSSGKSADFIMPDDIIGDLRKLSDLMISKMRGETLATGNFNLLDNLVFLKTELLALRSGTLTGALIDEINSVLNNYIAKFNESREIFKRIAEENGRLIPGQVLDDLKELADRPFTLEDIQNSPSAIGDLKASLVLLKNKLAELEPMAFKQTLVEEIDALLEGDFTRFESLRELIERAVEENEYLRAAEWNPAVRNNILGIKKMVSDLAGLINDERLAEAAENIQGYLRGHKALGQIYYDELWNSLKTITWAYFRPDKPEIALNLILELLGEDHPEATSPILTILRDRQAKNYFAPYLASDDNRRAFHEDAGDIYLFSAQENLRNRDNLDAGRTLNMLMEAKRHYLAALSDNPDNVKAKDGILSVNHEISRMAEIFQENTRKETGSILSATYYLYESYRLCFEALDIPLTTPANELQEAFNQAVKRDDRNEAVINQAETLRKELFDIIERFGESFVRHSRDVGPMIAEPQEQNSNVHP